MPPSLVISLMAPFRSFFTARVWEHQPALVTGMTLAPGKVKSATLEWLVGLGTPEAPWTPPFGFRIPQQNAIVLTPILGHRGNAGSNLKRPGI